jgi:ADP-ribosylglycohydrolase
MSISRREQFLGCLLGTAVGDAIGLPYEGLSARRAARLLGPPTQHRLIAGRGMVSDDTEHAVMTAQAWIEAGGVADEFSRRLAKRLRWWLLGLPAGIGKATLLACVRLWLGYPPQTSGVRSAGNGPAMRAPLLGLLARDEEELDTLVAASTRLTHSDPRALYGALVVASAVRYAVQTATPDVAEFSTVCHRLLARQAEATAMREAIAPVFDSLWHNGFSTTRAFSEAQGWRYGASGFILQTVPAVLHAWLLHPRDYRAAVMDVIEAGGDADTTAAIAGGILGSAVGTEGIPPAWQDGLWDSHANRTLLESLADALGVVDESRTSQPSPCWSAIRTPLRNGFFLSIVLAHGFRRLLPPYG